MQNYWIFFFKIQQIIFCVNHIWEKSFRFSHDFNEGAPIWGLQRVYGLGGIFRKKILIIIQLVFDFCKCSMIILLPWICLDYF